MAIGGIETLNLIVTRQKQMALLMVNISLKKRKKDLLVFGGYIQSQGLLRCSCDYNKGNSGLHLLIPTSLNKKFINVFFRPAVMDTFL